MKDLIQQFWRPLLILLLVTLPFFGMVALGLVWLLERGWLFNALIVMAGCGGLAFLLSRLRLDISSPLPNDLDGSPMEQKAKVAVQRIASEKANSPPEDLDELKKLATHVVNTVAREINGNHSFPWARFTTPEILAAISDASARLRTALQNRVPGSELITVAHVLRMHKAYIEHRTFLACGWFLYRLFRLISNPLNALVQEFKGILQDGAMRSISTVAIGKLTQVFVEELGAVAIKLYCGGYRKTVMESQIVIDESSPEAKPKVPIRVLVAGQVNAGKSSITNAMLGSIKSPVSELPTPGKVRAFRIDPGSPFDLVLLDAAGLTTDDSSKERKSFIDLCHTADLIVWVAKANQPARDIDVDVLRQIRASFSANPKFRQPPIVLAISHIDQIRPASEWSPPYNFVSGARDKETNVRDAMKVIAQTLEFDHSLAVIPMAFHAGASFNLSGLWDAIGENANESMLVALDREIKKGKFDLWQIFDQIGGGSRYVAKNMF